MSAALEYFLTSSRDIVAYETIEISHPSFTQVYRRVRNNANGITARLETGALVDFPYYPMLIEELGNSVDLDSGLRITFGDLGEVLPLELDAVSTANTFSTKPTVVYRVYRSDDLEAPLLGPLTLKVTTFTFNDEGATFQAEAPYANQNKTGETYNLTRFYMLRGYLK